MNAMLISIYDNNYVSNIYKLRNLRLYIIIYSCHYNIIIRISRLVHLSIFQLCTCVTILYCMKYIQLHV